MGFCIFNNVAITAMYLRAKNISPKINRVAIIDYDVHHGNGTQHMFWNDPNVLFISLHQSDNYPIGEGSIHEIGGKGAEGTNVNIPLPPGSGREAYRHAFDSVVVPVLDRFQPDFVIWLKSSVDIVPLWSIRICLKSVNGVIKLFKRIKLQRLTKQR
eukprot:gene4359-3118_t